MMKPHLVPSSIVPGCRNCNRAWAPGSAPGMVPTSLLRGVTHVRQLQLSSQAAVAQCACLFSIFPLSFCVEIPGPCPTRLQLPGSSSASKGRCRANGCCKQKSKRTGRPCLDVAGANAGSKTPALGSNCGDGGDVGDSGGCFFVRPDRAHAEAWRQQWLTHDYAPHAASFNLRLRSPNQPSVCAHLHGHRLHQNRLHGSVALCIDLGDFDGDIVTFDDFAKNWMSGVSAGEPIEKRVVPHLRDWVQVAKSPVPRQLSKSSSVDEELRPAGVWLAGVGHGQSALYVAVLRDKLVLRDGNEALTAHRTGSRTACPSCCRL